MSVSRSDLLGHGLIEFRSSGFLKGASKKAARCLYLFQNLFKSEKHPKVRNSPSVYRKVRYENEIDKTTAFCFVRVYLVGAKVVVL